MFHKKKNTDNLNKIVEFRKPKEVYIPLKYMNDTDITVIAKEKEHVFKGSTLGYTKGTEKFYFHSPVSGKVGGFKSRILPSGEKVKCIVIENDCKEQLTEFKGRKDNLDDYTKEDFIEDIQRLGVVGMSGGGFPAYLKYKTDKKLSLLIINATECEPFVSADRVLFINKMRDVLEAIDAIIEINGIKKCIIALKKEDKELYNLLNQYIGTYLNIKLKRVSNKYPIGWERKLVKDISHVTYDKYPNEKGIIVSNVTTAYMIGEVLKTNLPIMERIITLAGDGFKEKTNLLVKIGTPVKEIIEQYPIKDGYILIGGGPMMGYKLIEGETMVTKELNAIIALSPLSGEETPCIHCGKCIESCPANLYPVMIKNNCHNINKLKKLHPEKCIGCGKCSYVCPARIPLRDYVKEAKSSLEGNVKDE